MTVQSNRPPSVGAVSYLNTKPLVYDFDAIAPGIELSFDYPSRLADRLSRGELDIALIPSIEYVQQPDYQIVSDACIACRGPVLSVKLFSRTPVGQIRTLALDDGSRTSAALALILLRERFNLTPRCEPLPVSSALDDTAADAVLLIGDRAMHSPQEKFADVWDLGDEWRQWTGLPFVFAMWVARAGLSERRARELERALTLARDAGVSHLEEIAARESAPLGLTRPQCFAYLRDNLYFYLGERELAGLKLFYERASAMGLAPRGVELGIRHYQTAG